MMLALAMCATCLAPAPAWALSLIAPIPGPVVRRFSAPVPDWQSGHRGVDILGQVGEVVSAAAGGTITYAGKLAGRGVVTVTHGELRTTYEPVSAEVRVGDKVAAGQAIGTLESGHACPGGTCLHWGLKRGDTYLDPLSMLADLSVRLLPESAVGIADSKAAARAAALDSGHGIPGLFTFPANGEVGSGFGMRFHPIFKEWRMHEGVDIGASCGSPIRVAAPGVVERVSFDESGGHRLLVSHGTVGGHKLETMYLHAQGYLVHAGQKLVRGQVVGKVGDTGWATGCHLHFSVKVDGRHVDPEGFL